MTDEQLFEVMKTFIINLEVSAAAPPPTEESARPA